MKPTLLGDILRERWRASRLPSLRSAALGAAALTRTGRSREEQLSERRRAMDRGLLFAVRVTLGDSTTRVSFRLTNGNQIAVRNASEVARSNGDQRLGAARGGYELDFNRFWCIDIDHGPEIPTLET
jgi:hypothetical protein